MINQNVLVPSFLDAESSAGVLRNYCEGLKVSTETWFCLANFHNSFGLIGYQFRRQVQQLIVSLEAIINLNDSFINLKTLLIPHSQYTSRMLSFLQQRFIPSNMAYLPSSSSQIGFRIIIASRKWGFPPKTMPLNPIFCFFLSAYTLRYTPSISKNG